MLVKNLLAVSAMFGLALSASACTHAHGDPALAAEASISQQQAQTIALEARSGTVKEWELEREPGGSGLRYSFDIDSGGQTFEVGVDARDGAVLENAAEHD